jgi:4-amino-4-deoxy-L-arabinose transferase-like glycosyltransferase
LRSFAENRLESNTLALEPSARSLWLARIGLLFAAVVLYFWGAGDRGLWSAYEGEVAQNSANILQSGDWLLPRLHTGEVETQKPPMYYWLSAAAAKALGGVDGWSIRLPALLAGAAGLLLVFEFGRRIGGMTLALTAATILACTTRYAWLARVGRIDMALNVCVLGCLFIFWNARIHGLERNRTTKLPYSFYLLLSVALLLKGPVALILVALPILLWMAWEGRPALPFVQRGGWDEWNQLRVGAGLAIMASCAGSWFAYADVRTLGAYSREFFLYHNLGRLVGIDETLKASPAWAYVPRIAVDFFPWSLLLPLACVHYWKVRQRLRETSGGSTVAFLICWLFGMFGFLSLVSFKRMDYLLPVYPACALLIASWLDDRRVHFFVRRQTTVATDYRSRSKWIVVSAFLLAAAAAPLVFWGERQFARKGGLAKTILQSSLLDPHLNDTDEFMLLRVEHILREQWPLLGILLPGLVVAVWLLHTGWHERLTKRVAAGLAVPWAICFLTQVQVVMPRLDSARDMERFAQTIRHLAGPGQTIYYFDKFDSDLVFHAGKPARMVKTWDEVVELGRTHGPVFVVLRTDLWKERSGDIATSAWREIANNCQFAKHREPRSLLTNRPDDVVDRMRTAPAAFLR